MMNIKTIRNIAAVVLLAWQCAWQMSAQNATPTFTQTTLSAAMTANQQNISLASTTGVAVRTTLIQVGDEFMLPVAVDPIGTTTTVNIRVQRGFNGSRALAHPNGQVVNIAANANFGSCRGQQTTTFPCGFLSNAGNSTHYSSNLFFSTITPVTISTAGNVTYTAGQLLAGLILRNDGGSGRSDTLPTAALLVAAIPGATVDTAFQFTLRSTGSNTITVLAGTGATISGTATTATATQKTFLVRFSNVNSGAEAYTIYSMGQVTF